MSIAGNITIVIAWLSFPSFTRSNLFKFIAFFPMFCELKNKANKVTISIRNKKILINKCIFCDKTKTNPRKIICVEHSFPIQFAGFNEK